MLVVILITVGWCMRSNMVWMMSMVGMLACSTAMAASWQSVKVYSNGNEIFVDTSSISRTDQLVKGWVKEEYAKPQTSSDQPDAHYSSALMLEVADCSARKLAAVQIKYYEQPHGEGMMVHSVEYDSDNPDFIDLDPDMSDLQVFGLLCASK